MTRTLQFTIGLLSGASLIALGAPSASADHFRKINPKHPNYGVSQLNVTNVSRQRPVCLVLNNPNHVTQLAAVLMYQRPTADRTSFCPATTSALCTAAADFEEYLPEVFLGCLVVEMTPHSGVGLHDSSSTTWLDTSFSDPGAAWPGCPGNDRDGGEGVPRYAEVLWGPKEKVTIEVDGVEVTRRLANGLGGIAIGSAKRNAQRNNLMHPSAFALPSNDVVAGQREDAIECVCAGLADLFASGDTFRPFGTDCP